MIYYVSIITLTWRDSCIKRWQFSTSTVYHPKFEWATLPSFRHFRHLHSSWKGFDSGIRMQGYCLVQCSGVHQQVLADQWSVQTIWIARWKGMDILKRGGIFYGRVFKSWQRVFVRYDIDDLLCIHHHLDVARQLHQEMAIFDEYLVSSKVRMSNTPKFPSLSSPSLILKRFWFWDQDARILPCTMFRGPSAGPGRSVVSANNGGSRKIEQRQDGRISVAFNALPLLFQQVFGAPKAKPIQVSFCLRYAYPLTLQSTRFQKVCEQLHLNLRRWQVAC